jgi:hypothetical protein
MRMLCSNISLFCDINVVHTHRPPGVPRKCSSDLGKAPYVGARPISIGINIALS